MTWGVIFRSQSIHFITDLSEVAHVHVLGSTEAEFLIKRKRSSGTPLKFRIPFLIGLWCVFTPSWALSFIKEKILVSCGGNVATTRAAKTK